MTRDAKIAAILTALQTDVNVVALLRVTLMNMIPNVLDVQLDAALVALGIPQGD